MTEGSDSAVSTVECLAQRREQLAALRERARRLLVGGATGIQAAAAISEETDRFVVELYEHAVEELQPAQRRLISQHGALVAVGGTGRGDLAPHSDVDLLFLYHGPVQELYGRFAAQVVRDCWDAGVKLGHSVRSLSDSISLARADIQIATSLVETRCLSGNEELVERLRADFHKKVIRGRVRQFIDDCLAAREIESQQHGAAVGQLEPDVKRALGGLRDLHLIRWVGYACQGAASFDSLRLEGALGKRDARRLLAAWEYVTRIRMDLHFHAGKPQDVLTRDEQLRIAGEREIEGTTAQRPVELLMQTFFRHSTAIAEISRRFVTRQRPRKVLGRLVRSTLTHRADGIYKVSPDLIDAAPRHHGTICRSLESLLDLFLLASRYGVELSPNLIEAVREAAPGVSPEVTPKVARLFIEILSRSGRLGRVLRTMYATGVLELVVPEMAHTRCLLQFNQYHSYTVDEHTFRAIEAAEAFEDDDGPLGAAYRKLHHKEILHLALLLHDAGKGYEGDHSEIGETIADRVAVRLRLPEHQCEVLRLLVRKHLLMAHLAFRRDISEPQAVLQFTHDVGSHETLRMLFVLTAADMTAVGPGVWTDWKAELLSELYDSAVQVLGGQRYLFHREDRIRELKEQVRSAIVPLEPGGEDLEVGDWIDRQLDAFPHHYLTLTPASRVAADLDVVRELEPGEIVVETKYDAETGTVDYRVILHEQTASRGTHRIAGVLAAKRMEIISAQICKSSRGYLIDSFRVVDGDYEGEVPDVRLGEVTSAIESVLRSERSVRSLFQAHRRFGDAGGRAPTSTLPMRVVIDNDSSSRCTVIEVFAHDQPGLLYTISRTLFDLHLSIEQARISTHLDQVVDVFYVTDFEGRKVKQQERLIEIRETLKEKISDFEQQGYVQFV